MILTGQVQNANYTQANFQIYVCSQIPALFNCNSISIDVQSYKSFSQVSFPNFISNNLGYNPGGANCTVVVRVFYPWQLFVTGLGYNISNMGSNQRLLIAASISATSPTRGRARRCASPTTICWRSRATPVRRPDRACKQQKRPR